MNQKWKFLIILIFFLVIIIYFYMEKKDTENIGNIMEAIPTIDSVVAKDSNTKEKILKLTNTDSSFDYNMIDIYDVPFIKLKKSERKLLRDEPFIEIDFLNKNDIQFMVSVYRFVDKPILPDKISLGTDRYDYSPMGSKCTYIFALKEFNQLLGVNDELKALLNMILKEY